MSNLIDITKQHLHGNQNNENIYNKMKKSVRCICACTHLTFIYFHKYPFYLTSDDTSCERCYTSNYCLGDGESHKCARCDNETDSCNRSTSEHSFGAQSECSPCLDGWVFIQNNK